MLNGIFFWKGSRRMEAGSSSGLKSTLTRFLSISNFITINYDNLRKYPDKQKLPTSYFLLPSYS